MPKIKFPDDFLWGTSTAAHQVEGNNKKNQWWKWEQETDLEESGIACDHYSRYEDDIKLMADIGYNAYRFSIEWSRIEPREGEFDEEEIKHYKNIVNQSRENGIEPIPMLWHWTNPLWFMKKGGWKKKRNIDYFADFVRKISEEFEFDYWLTIDEPMVYANRSCASENYPPTYIAEDGWPKKEKTLTPIFKVASNLLQAHAKSYEIIREKSSGEVGMSKAVNVLEPASDSSLDEWSTNIRDYLENDAWLQLLKKGKPIAPYYGEEFGNVLDFFGINYFFGEECYFDEKSGTPPYHFFQTRPKENCEKSYLGWCIYPEGLYKVLKRIENTLEIPIMITSNGIATETDLQRRRFMIDHLKQMQKSMDDGVELTGYLHWSFMDNFEWARGFEPRFGLVEIDYENLSRIPRKSAYMFGEIARKNGINGAIEEKYL
ncbi:hypothetical protein AKJ65_01880 [candidate division MSBL1 archaeon SCGC-AAA259E19]|uniref:Beta-glucosidase n=1 Tax=candidate division MSBL1 archaeon SCGC-AAA259E19 TaxID=1698264 RepID=A0A133UMB3_9EURY|nr:hypothetical protein AKJ65_01880 [candidate division MSBL1 archaeon SCGC-AAA259E19]